MRGSGFSLPGSLWYLEEVEEEPGAVLAAPGRVPRSPAFTKPQPCVRTLPLASAQNHDNKRQNNACVQQRRHLDDNNNVNNNNNSVREEPKQNWFSNAEQTRVGGLTGCENGNS